MSTTGIVSIHGLNVIVVWNKVLGRRLVQFSRVPVEYVHDLITRHCSGYNSSSSSKLLRLLEEQCRILTQDSKNNDNDNNKKNDTAIANNNSSNDSRKQLNDALKNFLNEVYWVVIDGGGSKVERMKSLELIEGLFSGLDKLLKEKQLPNYHKIDQNQVDEKNQTNNSTPNADMQDAITTDTATNSTTIGTTVDALGQEHAAEMSNLDNDTSAIVEPSSQGKYQEQTKETNLTSFHNQTPSQQVPTLTPNPTSTFTSQSLPSQKHSALNQFAAKTQTLSKEPPIQASAPVSTYAEAPAPVKVSNPKWKKHRLLFEEELSSAVNKRSRCKLTWNNHDSFITKEKKAEFDERLRIWEPYWTCLVDLTPYYQSSGSDLVFRPCRTQRVIRCENLTRGTQPLGVAKIDFQILPSLLSNLNIKTDANEKPATKYQYSDGDQRIILRMLPFSRRIMEEENAQADCHLWPKGTFIQINKIPIPLPYIMQRKQQIHDPTLWTGMSGILDITPFVKNPTNLQELTLLTYDENDYIIQVAIMEYRDPTALQTLLLSTSREPPLSLNIHNLCLGWSSYDDSLDIAKKYLNEQTIVLDGGEADESLALTFQLICPIAMTPIKIPVRGRCCKHIQCFDLSNFLYINSFPSGRRWRCVCCDTFISVYELVHCGMFEQMIKDSSSTDDKTVEFKSDGTWKFMKESISKRKSKEKAPSSVLSKKLKSTASAAEQNEINLCE